MKKILSTLLLVVASVVGVANINAQQPQTGTAPLSSTNTKYNNGVGTGYWPTKGTGLVLNIAAGTSFCSGTTIFTAGATTISLTDNSTNYVFLDTGCTLGSNTTGFTAGMIPIATVTTASGAITVIQDDRTMMVSTPGGGGQIPPASAIYVFTGTSINGDDHNILGPAITISSYTRSGSVVSFVNTGTNGFSAGDWIDTRNDHLTTWPAPPSYLALGTGYTLFKVLTTGLSATTFQIDVGSLTPSNCASSCGTVSTAMNDVPFLTTENTSLPAAASNTYVFIPAPVTISGLATQYTSIFHAISPAQNGGRPGYLIINDHGNDDSTCVSNATTQAAYQSVFSQAHADGWIVVVGTGITGLWNQFTGCATSYQLYLNNHQWLLYQGKSAALLASGQYWDILDDTTSAIPDGANGNLLNGTFGSPTVGGSKAMAAQISGDIVKGAGTPIRYFPYYWGGFQGLVPAARGWVWQPSADSVFALQFQSADGSQLLGALDTISNRWYIANCLVVGFNTGSVACPSGYHAIINGGVQADHIIDTSLGNSTLPTCPNGASNELTTSGCTLPSVGTVTYTSSQSASTADNGKLVIMNCSSACSYTLPGTQPSTTWYASIQSIGSTTATIALGGGDTYNGSSSVPVLNKFSILPLWANTSTSTDYRGGVPAIQGTGITDIYTSNGHTLSATGGSTTVSTFTCADSSGSNSDQVCTASPTLGSVSVNTSITYTTTTSNAGTLTLNVSTLTPGAHVKKWGGSTDLAAGDMPADKSVTLNWDGTNWDAMDIGNAPAGGGGGGGGGESHTVSNATGLAFTSCITSAAATYHFSITGFYPVTTNADYLIQFSHDGGVTWDATAANYSTGRNYVAINNGSGAGNTPTITGVAGITLNGGGGGYGVAGQYVNSFDFDLHDPLGSNWKSVSGKAETLSSGGTFGTLYFEPFGGQYNQTQTINAVRIIADTGNISGSGVCTPVTGSSGGANPSGFPFTIIQSDSKAFAGGTSFTYTFPQALQSSGATALLVIATDGSTFTGPSGWTCTVNVAFGGVATSRLVACLKASAGDTTAVFTAGSSVSPSLRFYELSGSRSFDQFSTGSSANAQSISYPAITPAAGAAIFAVGTAIDNGTSFFPIAQIPPGSPVWSDLQVPTVSGNTNQRFIVGEVYTLPATATSTLPPPTQFVGAAANMYPTGGMAWITFSLQ